MRTENQNISDYFHVAINNNRMRPFEFDARSRGKIPTMFIFEDFLKKHMV